MSKIQIKRYNGTTTTWENQFPVTKAQNIVATDGTSAIFDSSDKINIAYLPDAVFDSLYFYGTIDTTPKSIRELADDAITDALLLGRSPLGYYWVSSGIRTVSSNGTAQQVGSKYYITEFAPTDTVGGVTVGDGLNTTEVIEKGDWLVITRITGAGTVGSPYVVVFGAIENTYETATTSVNGIVQLSNQTVYANLAGNNVITDARLKALIDSQNFTNTSHTHLLAAGATDVTATASELNVLDGITATTTELNYIDGVTSAIQTQLDGKAATSHSHTVANITDLTATATELNYTDGVTSAIQTQLDAKAPTANATFTGTIVLPSTTSIGTISATELSYVDGVTSAIQTQLNAKANLSGPTFTGTVVLPSTTSIGNVSNTEIGYLDGVTSAIQTQLNAKQATITGGATTILSSNLTASRALASDGSGKVAVSAVTATELGYLTGVTSAIQTQLTGLSSRVRVYYDGTPSGMVTDDIWFDAV
jgi:hypothetical protein